MHCIKKNPDHNWYSLWGKKKEQKKLNQFFSETTISSDDIHYCILHLCLFSDYRDCSTAVTPFYKPQDLTFVPKGLLPWRK